MIFQMCAFFAIMGSIFLLPQIPFLIFPALKNLYILYRLVVFTPVKVN